VPLQRPGFFPLSLTAFVACVPPSACKGIDAAAVASAYAALRTSHGSSEVASQEVLDVMEAHLLVVSVGGRGNCGGAVAPRYSRDACVVLGDTPPQHTSAPSRAELFFESPCVGASSSLLLPVVALQVVPSPVLCWRQTNANDTVVSTTNSTWSSRGTLLASLNVSSADCAAGGCLYTPRRATGVML
jgi:hypothetical protein